MRIACMRVSRLLKHREQGLSEAERLMLEAHLASCDACRRDSRAIDAIGDLIEAAAPPPGGAAAREQVIARALAAAARTGKPSARRAGARVGVGVVLGVVSVASLALVVAGSRLAWRTHTGAPAQPTIAAAAADHVVAPDHVASGEVRAGGRWLGQDEPVPSATVLSVPDRATLALGHARVAADAASELRWDPDRSVVDLRAGHLSVDVDPAPGRRFRVVTARFVVEVVGTAFEVDGDGVEVSRGVVHVLAADDGGLITELRAGQAWRVPVVIAEPVARHDGRSRRSAAAWLARARAHVASGAVADAERDITAALGAQPSPSEAAEASTLRAECAMVSGDPGRAADLYADVSRRYGDLPAGETALFAAARVQVNAGNRRAAAELLRAYLARYPQGRFRAEAVARLRALNQEQTP
jgi:ferric-dicitrate binding protein FerR (iron transport regulator)